MSETGVRGMRGSRPQPTPHAFITFSSQRLLIVAPATMICEKNTNMDEQRQTNTDGASLRAAFYNKDQTLCTQLLNTITAAVPLQILPSKITGAGVGLFTTKDVDCGEEIFRSSPVVNCVADGMQSLVCDNCYAYQESKVLPSGRFRTAEDSKLIMKACSGCKVCYYCSKACQRKAWKRYHKLECVMFSEAPAMPPRTRGLYRILVMGKHQLLSQEQQFGLRGLQPHIKNHLSGTYSAAIAGTSMSAKSRTGTDLSSNEVLTLHCSLLTNSLSIYQAEGQLLGTSLDVVASLMNHSCNPSAFVVFEGESLCVHSLRKLKAGDEVTQCYTDVDMDVLLRRQTLRADYFFDCCCERCKKQMQTHEERYPGMIEQIKQSQQQMIEFTNEAIRLEDVDNFEINAQNIAKHAFPGGDWPEDLGPWPTMRIRFAEIFKARGCLTDALLQGVRGYLSLERRTGDKWIRHLFDLLQIFTRILLLPNWNTPCENSECPTQAQLWDILRGYLYVLALGAKKLFGARAEYTQAIQTWYSDCVRAINAPHPGTRAFARRFKRAQSQLLLWARVDENRGIALA